MKFQCLNPACTNSNNHKLFHYPMKVRTFEDQMPNFEEIQVCPYCQSKDFTEYTDPVATTDALEDMQLVEFSQVPTYIAKGYVELDRKDHVFAKGIIMLKTKPKIPEIPNYVNPDPDDDQAFMEQAEQAYSKIPEAPKT